MRIVTLTEEEAAWLMEGRSPGAVLPRIQEKIATSPAYCRTCLDDERRIADPDDYRHDTVENCSAILIREGRGEGCGDRGVHHPYRP